MDRSDEYRKNARLCQEMANSARNEQDKRSWLELAASWLGMLQAEEHTKADVFDTEASKRGTGQPDSESWH